MQGPPMTPDLRQQETYAPATDSSLPPSQESSFSYYPDTAPSHDPSYYQVWHAIVLNLAQSLRLPEPAHKIQHMFG